MTISPLYSLCWAICKLLQKVLMAKEYSTQPSKHRILQEPQREKVLPEVEVEVEECGVCLDAKVEVEIDNCHHKLCCECAKAICCLEVPHLPALGK